MKRKVKRMDRQEIISGIKTAIRKNIKNHCDDGIPYDFVRFQYIGACVYKPKTCDAQTCYMTLVHHKRDSEGHDVSIFEVLFPSDGSEPFARFNGSGHYLVDENRVILPHDIGWGFFDYDRAKMFCEYVLDRAVRA